MVMEFLFGQLVISMRDIGKNMKEMVKGLCIFQMAIDMKEILKKIFKMDKEK